MEIEKFNTADGLLAEIAEIDRDLAAVSNADNTLLFRVSGKFVRDLSMLTGAEQAAIKATIVANLEATKATKEAAFEAL